MKKPVPSQVERHIYKKGHDLFSQNVDMEKCRFGIHDDFHFYQCSFLPSTEIDGYKFCKRHAKHAKRVNKH